LTFITEHLYIGTHSKANLDFGHGPGTRVPMKSGVFVDQPPFSLHATRVGDIPSHEMKFCRGHGGLLGRGTIQAMGSSVQLLGEVCG